MQKDLQIMWAWPQSRRYKFTISLKHLSGNLLKIKHATQETETSTDLYKRGRKCLCKKRRWYHVNIRVLHRRNCWILAGNTGQPGTSRSLAFNLLSSLHTVIKRRQPVTTHLQFVDHSKKSPDKQVAFLKTSRGNYALLIVLLC